MASSPALAFSVCPHDCPSACALDVDLETPTHIGRIHGAKDHPYTAGVVCAKVARYAERVHHPERLTTPLRRVGAKGEGRFTPISWDEALEATATALKAAHQTHGAESVWPYYYAGTMGQVQRDGINRLRNVMGWSRQRKTFCSALANAGWTASVGALEGTDPREMAESEVIVLWGVNPVHTQINLMTWVKRAGAAAKVVVVDPYRTATAEKADHHLMLRPGTDAALACAVMHVLFAEGLADRAWMARHTDTPEALEAHLQTRTPAWAAEITGLSEAEIIAFARLYGSTKKSFLRLGYGFTRSRNGVVSMHAVSCLPSVTGAWAVPGGGALFSASGAAGLDKTLIEGLDARTPGPRELDMSQMGAVLTGDPAALHGGPPVKAIFLQNTNPAVTAPRSDLVRQGLLRDDLFLCVHEQFLTETAAYADIVLPATTFLEHEDIYTAGAHPFLQAHRAVLPPHGQSRSNHEVICDLARRLGAEHEGFTLSAVEIIDRTLKASNRGTAEDLFAARWLDCARQGAEARFANGFPTADGKFHFSPAWGDDRLPSLPDYLPVIDAATADKPFRLVAAPARHFLNTSFNNTPTSRALEKRPTLLIHPEDAQGLGLGEGAAARIGNDHGAVTVHARLFTGLPRGVVVVESLWPNADFAEGIGINTLVSDEPAAPKGGAVYHDTAVWIAPTGVEAAA